MKAGVSAASIARPMHPLRIERVAVHTDAEAPAVNGRKNGHVNGHANGNGNGNGKGRKSKAGANGAEVLVTTEAQGLPELLMEVGGE
jgi:hypothetical protein